MAATLKATTMLGAAVSGARPAGLKAALPIRRRAGVVRVANIAAPAEELLGNQPQSTQPRFEVGWLLEAWPLQLWALQCLQAPKKRPWAPSYGRGWCCWRAAAACRRHCPCAVADGCAKIAATECSSAAAFAIEMDIVQSCSAETSMKRELLLTQVALPWLLSVAGRPQAGQPPSLHPARPAQRHPQRVL